MTPLLASTLAGLTASVPMLGAMELLRRTLPGRDDSARTPPRSVTMQTLRNLRLPRPRTEPARQSAMFLAHLAFGAAAAVPFPYLARRAPGHPIAKGIAWGLAVGIAAYSAALPAADIQPPMHRRPPRRGAIILLSHVVWGAILGHLSATLSDNPRDRA